MVALHGTGVTFPTPPTPPIPGAAPPTLALDRDAKKQELRKALTFFATTNVDSTLEVGGSVKRTTRGLAAGKKTKVTAKLKKSTREKLEDKLEARPERPRPRSRPWRPISSATRTSRRSRSS